MPNCQLITDSPSDCPTDQPSVVPLRDTCMYAYICILNQLQLHLTVKFSCYGMANWIEEGWCHEGYATIKTLSFSIT